MEPTLELSPGERDGLWGARFGAEPALRAQAASLLRASGAERSLGSETTSRQRRSKRPQPSDPSLGPSLAEREIGFGDWLGPYRILDELGRGGMGTVYLAHPEDGDGERVAVKVVHRGLPRRAWRRFRTEYWILSGLDHPGIAQVLDAGATCDGRPFFVMEHIEGMEIEEYCEDRRLSAAARLELVLKVCDAIDAAHRQGVVHRDLKPSNILVTAGGQPKLLDFGIAKLLDREARGLAVESTGTDEYLLTPQYASPEQIRVEEITPRTDVYSVAVVLYKLLTGRLPYVLERYTLVAMEHAFEKQTPARPSRLAAARGLELSEDLDAVVMTALSVKARERFGTVDEFSRALRESLGGGSSTARTKAGRLRRLRFATLRMLGRLPAWESARIPRPARPSKR